MKKVTIGAKPSTGNHGRSAEEWVTGKTLPMEPSKRLTIDIPLTLHRRIKSACALENRKMADVVRELLERQFTGEPGLNRIEN